MKSKSELIKQPWWNRPIWGDVSLWERIIGILNPQKIPDLALCLYENEFEHLSKIEPTLRMLESEEYSEEFLFYMAIKQKIDYRLDEYQELADIIQILNFTTKTIKYFRSMARIELDFRGKTQVKLYDFIKTELNSSQHPQVISQNILDKIEALILNIRNEPTKEALMAYKLSLTEIFKQESGVNIFKLIKNKNITNYLIFNIVYSLVKEFRHQDLCNLESLRLAVEKKSDEINILSRAIGIAEDEKQIETYSKIIQYIALYYRYEFLIFRFEQLIEKLNQWNGHYQKIQEIKQGYPSHQYKITPLLSQKIPGESIYFKYKHLVPTIDSQ